MKNILYLFLFILLFCFTTDAIAQTTRLVAKTGTDASNCTGTPCLTINYAIGQAAAGDIIQVADGNYTENVIINKNIKLYSVNGRDVTTITGISAVLPTGALGTIVVTNGSNGVEIGAIGKGFKVIGIDNNIPGNENAAIYFQENHTNVKVVGNEVVANGDHGLLSLPRTVSSGNNGFLIDNNIFSGKTFQGAQPGGWGFNGSVNPNPLLTQSDQFTFPNVPRQLVVMGNGGSTTNSHNITFTNNQVIGTAGGTNSDGREQGNTLVTIDGGNTIIRGNTFAGTTTRFGSSLRTRGEVATQTIENNTFSNANMPNANSSLALRAAPASTPATAADFTRILALNRVDAAASVRSVTSPTTDGAYATAAVVNITVQFNAPVIVTGGASTYLRNRYNR